MIQFIYVSSAVKPFTNDELVELLDRSRRNNEKLGITGMLLYRDGDFMQVLEGDGAAVRWLSSRISRDPRHRDVKALMDGPATEREFPDWSMGFRNLDDLDPQEVPDYSTFLDSRSERRTSRQHPPSLALFFCCSKTKLHVNNALRINSNSILG